jgi:xanthine dehydrogenase molybdenum-binding subunit
MLDYKPNIVLSNQEYKVVGKRPIRHDGAEKVTGQARYGADITLPGMLYGKILRSPHPHARIKSIDTRHAEEVPGVHAVITAADLAQPSPLLVDLAEGVLHNMRFLSNNIMAADKVLYKGHAVAAVAATSPHIAEEALALIQVDYEVLPVVPNADEAMKEGATLLHERLAQVSNPSLRPGGYLDDNDPNQGTNVANRFEFRLGDVDKGFQEADVIIEKETRTSPIHQGYIEPHTGTAQWHSDGTLTIWSSSQGHFNVRDQTARLMDMPVSKVKAIPLEIGGGFGGKTLVYVEPVAAALARKANRPVKVTMSRTEVFEATGPTSGTHIRVKLGATRDGKFVAAEAHLIYEAGAFPGSPVSPACQCMMAPYVIPNTWIEGFDVLVNKPKAAAYRAPGVPAAAFAMETAIDELCEKLDMDPLAFRLKNSAKEGDRSPTGPVWPKVGFAEVVQAAMEHPHYATPLEGPYRGRGVASGFWRNNTGPSSAVALVHADGTVRLTEGSPDIGGTRTSVSQQFAETLGIPVEDVNPSVGDTDSVGFTSVTGGSGVTFKTGRAAYETAQQIKQRMRERAARMWDCPVDEVEYRDGELVHTKDADKRLTFKQVAARQNATGGPITAISGVNPPGAGPSLGTHIVDLEVDPDTGKVTILRYTAVQDAGKAIHPSYVEGQIQGGVVQGIGWALNEEYYFSQDARMLNSSFLDYRMPTCLDLPMIDTVIVEVANPTHPYGVRGVGETPIIPPLAAVANAVYDAIGVRINQLPMSPGRILEALWSKDGATQLRSA